ncbi:MAG TPA: RsmD family RNA methyltransferase [Paludibacteraceae bacterium]|jgi:16S rRNA (guanine(966)-N(2))-methyltransferase RsmD|nr:RsmD family RNA methyltransferase [Paludibacteraceae bacterium]HQF49781.1 RsmD family RNA methyltransferase [Paludibacteraceae bacterium]HQJ90435.1 RsmD family RNA methyltransferase [Paludibacteraceae bacterium]
MRIVSGIYKGRRFNPPANLKARPTTDIAKEGLFNILNNIVDFEELKVLDMFGGTGNISMEMASRGCKDITLLELNAINYAFIRKVIGELNIDCINAIRGDAFRFIEKTSAKYDLIFADPPYDHKELEHIPDLIFEHDLLNEDGLFIMEHPRDKSFTSHPNFHDHRNYGHVNFTFFK